MLKRFRKYKKLIKSTNDMYNAFHTAFLQIIDKNAPYKTLSKSEKNLG